MKLQLFTKTYRNDFEWIRNAIRSVLNHSCDTKTNWHIICEDDEKAELEQIVQQQKNEAMEFYPMDIYVVGRSQYWGDTAGMPGYLAQQWIKMNAHRVITSGYILNWDSDVIAKKPFSHFSFCGADKPILYFTPFNHLITGGDVNIHNQRRFLMKEIFQMPEIAFEWMRGMPLWTHSEILRVGSERREWKMFYEKLKANAPGVSEFNIIGQLSNLYFPDAYEYRNTQNYKTWSGAFSDAEAITVQSWSYGGITQEAQENMAALAMYVRNIKPEAP
jgi:hypothetical protein